MSKSRQEVEHQENCKKISELEKRIEALEKKAGDKKVVTVKKTTKKKASKRKKASKKIS